MTPPPELTKLQANPSRIARTDHGEGRVINRSAALREAERLHYKLSHGAYPEFNPEELPLELSNLELIIKHFS